MNKIFIKILGCGASVGCPIPGCKCAVCSSENSKNNRTRTSIYIRHQDTQMLIDCGTDLRNQMLKANISSFDYIFLTHKHLDHIAGMDDLRISFFNRNNRQIEIFSNIETIDHCLGSFGYMFYEIKFKDNKSNYHSGFNSEYCMQPRMKADSKDLINYSNLNKYLANHQENRNYLHNKPLLSRVIENFDTTVLPSGLIIQNYEQQHGRIKSLGYLIGKFAYSTDVKSLPKQSLEILKNAKLKLFIISLTHFEGNNAHASFEEMKKIVEYIEPEMVVFTHMSHQINYEMDDMLEDNMEFAYDGMEFEI